MAKTTNTGFDPEQFKDLQRKQWSADAAGWNDWEGTFNRWYGGVTSAMLDHARLQPGQRVLDIGSGTGEPALSAADRVGPDGYVLATDIAPGILDYAAQNAQQRGLVHVETLVTDSELGGLSAEPFDAVLGRFVLMYVPEPEKSLAVWRRILRNRGRVVVAAFTAPANNAWGAVPASVIRRRAKLPPPIPGQLGVFALSGDGELESLFDTAGYRDIDAQILQAPLQMESASEFTRYAREAFGGFNQLMTHLPRQERELIWDDVTVEMEQFTVEGGIEIPCEVRIVSASR